MIQNKERLQTKLDIQLIYSRGRKFLAMDQQRNRNMINILKHGEKLIAELEGIPNKNGQVYSKYHRLFKLLRTKALAELEEVNEETTEMAQTLKKNFTQVIEEIAAKARRYEEAERRLKEIGKMHVQAQQEGEEHEERIKEEMVDLMQAIKAHAKDLGQDLKKDTSVISEIGQKQDEVLSSLNKENSAMKVLAKNSKMGFFTLISYSAIAVVLWILTMMLIIVF